jgi:hypothetical protein
MSITASLALYVRQHQISTGKHTYAVQISQSPSLPTKLLPDNTARCKATSAYNLFLGGVGGDGIQRTFFFYYISLPNSSRTTDRYRSRSKRRHHTSVRRRQLHFERQNFTEGANSTSNDKTLQRVFLGGGALVACMAIIYTHACRKYN